MAPRSYLDFDLCIEHDGKRYRARLLRSPTGGTTRPFHWPFAPHELEKLVAQARPTSGGMLTLQAEIDAAKELGDKLYRAVFADEVLVRLRESLALAQDQGAGLRIRLQLSPDLINIPWEFLYDAPLNRFLVLSSDTTVVRYLDLPERIRPLAVKPPLRILVMIASPEGYEPRLDVEAEWQRLRSALTKLEEEAQIVVELLPQATFDALRLRLSQRDYHIFHFVGHGGFSSTSENGVLIMENEVGEACRVSSEELGRALYRFSSLRLVILNSCEGGRAAENDAFAGVAQELLRQRVPAVIAMQFKVSVEAAAGLSHAFYQALAVGGPVDAALAEARWDLSFSKRAGAVEWGTPVLYMRSMDGVLFDMAGDPRPVQGHHTEQPLVDRLAAPAALTQPAPPPDAPVETQASSDSMAAPFPAPAQGEPKTSPRGGQGSGPPGSTMHGAGASDGRRARRFDPLWLIAVILVVGSIATASLWILNVIPHPAASATARQTAAVAAIPTAERTRMPALTATTSLPPTSGGAVIPFSVASETATTPPTAASTEAASTPTPSRTPLPDVSVCSGVQWSARPGVCAALLDAYLGEVENLFKEAHPDQAMALLDELIDLQPDLDETSEAAPSIAKVYSRRGSAFNGKGEPKRAVDDLERAVELDPTLESPYLHLGIAYTNRNSPGDQDRAIAILDQAMAMEIKRAGKPSGYTVFRRCVASFVKEAYGQSIIDCTKAIELDPKYDQPYYYRGRVYLVTGDYDAAIADFTRAIPLRPENHWPYYYRGLAYKGKGERDSAIEDFEKILEISKDAALRALAEQQLRELRGK